MNEEFYFTLPAGSSKRLKTAGKLCDRDIVVTAEGIDALEALCDWEVTGNSSSEACVNVTNYHPRYYLKCNCLETVSRTQKDLEVPPNNSNSVIFDDIKLDSIQGIYVTDWRWVKSV